MEGAINPKVIFLVIFITCFASILQAGELDIPLPQDAVKVSESSPNLGLTKSYSREYNTSLNKNEALSFYKKEMLKAGWKEDEEGIFMKGNDMAVITVGSALDAPDKVSFVVSTSRIPTKEDFDAMRKKNPDKLNFMPVYPGSEQVYLWDLEHGVFGQYETAESIKNVVFFYKSGMLNYGWGLVSETSNVLEFSKGDDETCRIEMGNVSFKKSTLPVAKTTISATYYKNEKNKLF